MKITLAGKEYEVRPLTLRQIRDMAAATAGAVLPDPDPGAHIKKIWDARVEVLVQALQRDNQEITADFIFGLPITHEELFKTHDEILRFSGLIPKEASAPGEAVAEAA